MVGRAVNALLANGLSLTASQVRILHHPLEERASGQLITHNNNKNNQVKLAA